MKIVVYGPSRRLGAIVGEQVIDLNRASAARVPADLEAFVALGAAGLDQAQEALARVASAPDDAVQPLADVKLHPPLIYRPRNACAGANYVMHAVGTTAALQGDKVDPRDAYNQARAGRPWGFWKVISDVRGDQEDVVYPARAQLFDYEGEVAVVLGRAGTDIPAGRAHEYICGVTLFNDWSIRNDMGPARPLSFNVAKNFNNSVSIGPCIVVGEVDAQEVVVETRVNGDVRQHYSSSEMTFTFAELVEFLSRDFTFLPGDVIAGGTGAGTAMDSSPRGADGYASTDRFLKPDDLVEVSSPAIGALRNRVVVKTPAKPEARSSAALG
jgi:2-keto-4-pentenoate hydratase/2-oxohepta-3-ene-1,7-dioic acid hydratase in catechol pathway